MKDKLLAIIADHPDSTGAELAKLSRLGTGELYPALVELERDGKITAKWVGTWRPRKRVYSAARTG